MAKSKQTKEQAVQVLVEGLKNSKSAVFANFQGLKVSESEELRAICRKQGIKYIASKKTLLGRALKELGLDVDTGSFEGGPAVVFGTEDEVAPAQIVAKFAKAHQAISLFGGILEGAFIDTKKVTELSALPSKQELLAKMVGSLNAPISGFVNVLAGNLRGLVRVLSAIKETKA